ncbi:MAG: aldehyde dehydrogenase family protein [Fimbriimonas sp.]|nr:aldehyde dehydrogenase family protein [Fimbriimonas sp.]
MHAELLVDGYFVGGPCDQSIGKLVLRSPYDGKLVGTAAEGAWPELRACIDGADAAFESWRRTSRQTRRDLLRRVAELVRERHDELAEILTLEIGKPITASRGEVDRLALTFDFAADLVLTYGLESVPLDLDPRGFEYRCEVERFPRGVVFCIVPYNWPYNLAAHKIAPALATGNTVIVKPSPLAPISTLTLLRLIHEAGCPAGVINGWNGPASLAEKALADPRIKMLSFTGSEAVGWHLRSVVTDRPVSLELGGDAYAIVCEDADLEWATKRIVAGAFSYAGQICISIQHVLVHRSNYDSFRERLIAATESCPFGDPSDSATVCGPLISDEAATKVESMIQEALDTGAKCLAGGRRHGRVVTPTLLEGVAPNAKLSAEEAFGPVLTLDPFDDVSEAIAKVNRSRFGIQSGVFTNDIRVAEQAFRELEVGGVIVNDFPTLRFDNMPYGGVKRSGFGREGVRYAMDEMTEPKTFVKRVV